MAKTQAEKNAIVEHNFVEKYRKKQGVKAKKGHHHSFKHIEPDKAAIMQIR